jgi:lysophospholipase L1-like esterase
MRIVAFGDSWTAGHGVETDIKYKEIANPPKFIEKLRLMNSWPRWLAEKFECEFVNCGVSGYGNEFIYKDLYLSIINNFIKKDDIIIVMLSYPYRYSADTYNVIDIFDKMENTLKDYKHYYLNSFYPTFKNEILDVNELPTNFINPTGSVSDILKDYEIQNNVSVWEYESRSVWNDKQNFWEGDYHPNTLGYKIIANYIYKQINE